MLVSTAAPTAPALVTLNTLVPAAANNADEPPAL